MEIKEIKKIEFVKDWCIMLVAQDDNKYVAILGKCGKIKFQTQQNTISAFSGYYKIMDDIIKSISSKIEIPLIAHNDKLFTIITLNNEQEYETIKTVLEVVL